MTYLLVFFTSLISTLFLTPYFISYLRKINIVDLPGGRRINKKIVPRMGGLIIFLVVLVMLNTFAEDLNSIKLLIVAVSVLMFCGIIDDVIGLKSLVKLILQNIAAVIILYYLSPKFSSLIMFGFEIPDPFQYLVLIVFIVGSINAVNLLDGLDGLASGFSLLIFSIILVLAIISNDSFLILVTVSLIGSLLGFLRFNAFPASIFLGDTGSLVLGFFLVVTALLTSLNFQPGVLDLTFPLMLLAVPIIDTIKVFFFRLMNKKNPFTADTNHLHHIIFRNNVKHEFTVFLIEIFTLAFVLLSLFYIRGFHFWTTILFFVLSISLIWLGSFFGAFKASFKIRRYYSALKELPFKKLIEYKRTLLYLSSTMILFIIVLSFPVKTTLETNEVLFLIFTCFVLLMLAYLQQSKTNKISQINVFLNFTIFFIVSKLSLPSLLVSDIHGFDLTLFHDISFIFLAILILLSFLSRAKAFSENNLFLSGIDLTMIAVIILAMIVNKVLHFDFNYFLSISLLEAFIFYLWYKVVVNIKDHLEKHLSYLSFVLPISSLLVLFIFQII